MILPALVTRATYLDGCDPARCGARELPVGIRPPEIETRHRQLSYVCPVYAWKQNVCCVTWLRLQAVSVTA